MVFEITLSSPGAKTKVFYPRTKDAQSVLPSVRPSMKHRHSSRHTKAKEEDNDAVAHAYWIWA